MNGIKYKQTLYFITIVILLTLCVQGYWSYKNYISEKKQLITDVQVSLDNAIDSYFTGLAKKQTLKFISDSIHSDSIFSDSIFMGIKIGNLNISDDSILTNIEGLHYKDSILSNNISIIKSKTLDSFNNDLETKNPHILKTKIDSFRFDVSNPFELLTSKIVVSFSEDSLSLDSIDSLLLHELKRKDIPVLYGLSYNSYWNKNQKLRENIINSSLLTASASSSFLMDGSSLVMHFDNITRTVLKRNAISIFISLILVSSIIICLLYLLKIIQKQKELAEIKNDLISNITHEFKTPLATISVALEGIQRFNLENDSEKSKKYAQMSRGEVEKLTLMVEKLLETATLDSDNLHLNLQEANLVSVLEKAIAIDEDLLNGKSISFSSTSSECIVNVEPFHFENAINNIIDNAIKYGGNAIDISIEQDSSETKIYFKDNGKALSKQQAIKIFDKFYRVPKGNTHDVKGFGIGLYYTKNIIEKHEGTVIVDVKNGTNFTITLPNK